MKKNVKIKKVTSCGDIGVGSICLNGLDTPKDMSEEKHKR
jgi:hypothetical protein